MSQDVIARKKSFYGFSLIELMIVVAIAGALVAIALPNYQHHVRKSRRQEVMADMANIQMTEERYRSQHSHYATSDDLKTQLPANKNYSSTITTPSTKSPSSYVVTAIPQAGNDQENDKEQQTSCSTLSVDHKNTKTPPDCWSK